MQLKKVLNIILILSLVPLTIWNNQRFRVSAQTTGVEYYVSPNGNDSNSGTLSSPFKTITKAVSVAKNNLTSGVEIILFPGVYRESVTLSGIKASLANPFIIKAKDGPGTTYLFGSEGSKASNYNWIKSDDNQPLAQASKGKVYYADVPGWTESPEIAAITNNNQLVQRIYKSKEPDIDPYAGTVNSDRRWTADGRDGSTYNTLIDKTNDAGSDTGNITNINGFTTSFLVGARIIAKDGYSGHDENSAIITGHDPANGKITFNKDMDYFTGTPLVEKTTKYFLEGKPQFIDEPWEWYHDTTKKRIYVFVPDNVNISNTNIEFAIRNKGFVIQNSSNIYIKDINIAYVNYGYTRTTGLNGGIAIYNDTKDYGTENILIDKVNISDSGIGIRLYQPTGSGKVTQNITIRNSNISYTRGHAIIGYQAPSKDSSGNYIEGIKRVNLHNNKISFGNYWPTGESGYSNNANMIWFQYVREIIMTDNIVSNSAHNGIEIHAAGNMNSLVINNIFENNCRSGSDCGGFKVFAGNYSSSNFLVANNIARDTYGCSYAADVNNKWFTSDTRGCGGFGLYSDIIVSTNGTDQSVTYYKNLVYNNVHSGIHITRSNRHGVMDNILINNPTGVRFTSGTSNSENQAGSKLTGNIIIRNNTVTSSNRDYGIDLPLNPELRVNVTMDKNIYKLTGTNGYDVRSRRLSNNVEDLYKVVSDIKAGTIWEDNGQDTTKSIDLSNTSSTFSFNNLYNQILTTPSTPPTEVSSIINSLNSKYGINVRLNDNLGLEPNPQEYEVFDIKETTTPPVCTGDVNNDKVVDLSDYTIFTSNYFKIPIPNPKTDLNSDGIVDITDYGILTQNFFKICN